MRLKQHFISDIVLKISIFMPYFRRFLHIFRDSHHYKVCLSYSKKSANNLSPLYYLQFYLLWAAFLLVMAQPVWQAYTGKNKLFGDGNFVLLFIALVVYKFKAV